MILNIYKPKGRTSFSVVAEIRRKLGVKKVGHAGTLDPLAEGVLIILTEKDTKRQSEFMEMQKEYEAEIGFGIFTESYDLEFVPKFVEEVSKNKINNEIEKVLAGFVGEQDQEVPMYSAVSVDGQRLYKLARKGKVLEKAPSKKIQIHEIKLLDFGEREIETDKGAKNIPVAKIRVRCSSGTYVRALVRDVGKSFDTRAVMMSLIRTVIGPYKISDSRNIEIIS